MTNIEIRAVTPKVTLLNPEEDFLRRIYTAFKTCYASERPQEIWDWADVTPKERMIEYIERRLQTEHTSPTEHAVFMFAISGVSRVFTHQFVRHRVGISIAQQSGRYTDPLETGVFEYVEPASYGDRIETVRLDSGFRAHMKHVVEMYESMINAGIPREDARMALPNLQATNMAVSINFAALQKMLDVRLCTAAQWEYRRVAALMRAEVKRVEPVLAKHLGPKCMANRRGACDEDMQTYHGCALSAVRPHRSDATVSGNHQIDQGLIGEYLEAEAAL